MLGYRDKLTKYLKTVAFSKIVQVLNMHIRPHTIKHMVSSLEHPPPKSMREMGFFFFF